MSNSVETIDAGPGAKPAGAFESLAKIVVLLPRCGRAARQQVGVVDVGEARLVFQEAQLDVGHGAVAVLGDDQLGHARRGHSVLVLVDAVVFGTVYEGHDVGVLLDGARLAQVRQLRPLRARRATRSNGSAAKGR